MTADKSFRLAPMSALIRGLTFAVLVLPFIFFVAAALGSEFLALPAIALLVLYAWVWLRFRPTRFVVSADALDVIWPLKSRRLPRERITGVRPIDVSTLRQETGWVARVGVGGLWGAFGWLWTERKGIVQMYASRGDGLVWIELRDGRPWLVTPADPEAFIGALTR